MDLIPVLFAHFIGDFILQSDWMAQNKSKSNKALLIHVAVYSLPLFLFGWQFAILNAVIHGAIDYMTSRIASQLWADKQVHWFFVVIGFDQFLHTACLLTSYSLLLPLP